MLDKFKKDKSEIYLETIKFLLDIQIEKNCTAPKAAGTIHTDFEKGFIRSETISFKDFVDNNGWTNSKANGKMRLEGKDYIVKDGDVLNFRFNT